MLEPRMLLAEVVGPRALVTPIKDRHHNGSVGL